jgi:23S rRNA (pseudouridine1915-N3)-methyltransferase
LRVTLLAVGKLGQCPEAGLVSDYLGRATASGRNLGLGPVNLIEVEARKSGKGPEAEVLMPHLNSGAVIACDEHGQAWSSRQLAERVAKIRDDGQRQLTFVIGGADGLSPDVLSRADQLLAFGPQTWPHALVRVMLAEQVYRTVTILAGSPYHRD